MKNEQTQIKGNELLVILFALIAGWFLLFQSGLVR
ncbi:hypothetical protein BH20ACI4_BH20ACI4_29670 [soil metagenome]